MSAILAAFAFVPSWLWKWLAVAVAVLSLIVYVDRKATYRERAVCERKAQEAIEKARRQDAEADRVTKVDESSTGTEIDKQRAINEQLMKELSNAKSKVASPANCGYTRDDLDRYDRVR